MNGLIIFKKIDKNMYYSLFYIIYLLKSNEDNNIY